MGGVLLHFRALTCSSPRLLACSSQVVAFRARAGALSSFWEYAARVDVLVLLIPHNDAREGPLVEVSSHVAAK